LIKIGLTPSEPKGPYTYILPDISDIYHQDMQRVCKKLEVPANKKGEIDLKSISPYTSPSTPSSTSLLSTFLLLSYLPRLRTEAANSRQGDSS
jgi:hypothetical protein